MAPRPASSSWMEGKSIVPQIEFACHGLAPPQVPALLAYGLGRSPTIKEWKGPFDKSPAIAH
jgi:hypothetical protein